MSVQEYRKQGNRKPNNDYEHQEQVTIFEWAEVMKKVRPDLEMMFAVPNGGVRDWKTGAKLKAEGAKAGVPDICLPVPVGKYHGLYIELKYGKNKPRDTQKWWLHKLSSKGYCVMVCWGAEEAIKLIEDYLDEKEIDHQEFPDPRKDN